MAQQLSPALELRSSSSTGAHTLSLSSPLSAVIFQGTGVESPLADTSTCDLWDASGFCSLIVNCELVLNHICWSPSKWLTLCPCAKGHWYPSGAQPLCWMSPCELLPKITLNLCESVKLFRIRVLRLIGGLILLYSQKKRTRSLSPSWRVQVQIPRPDTS